MFDHFCTALPTESEQTVSVILQGTMAVCLSRLVLRARLASIEVMPIFAGTLLQALKKPIVGGFRVIKFYPS